MQKSPEHLSVQAIQRLCLLMGAFRDHLGLMRLVVYCQELKTAFKNENLLLISVGLEYYTLVKQRKKIYSSSVYFIWPPFHAAFSIFIFI